MPRFFHPLIALIANVSERQMLAYIEYLKTENQMLRAKLPKRIVVTPYERARLVKLGRRVGPALRELVSIVTYRTFRRWMAEVEKPKAAKKARRGRPRTPEEICELVIRIARETGWGYARILSELKKLRVHNVSKTTIRKILKEAGLDPGPQRGAGSWDEFLKIHAQSLWACDFISKKVWTLNGLVDYFVLFFIHLGSRQVVAYPATARPNGAWVAQQARNFVFDAEERGLPIGHVIHDWDTKFTGQFATILRGEGATIHRVGPAKPNLNAYAERFAQTLKHECLDHFVVLGQKHLDHLIHEFIEH